MNTLKVFFFCFVYLFSFATQANHRALDTSCVFTDQLTEKTVKKTNQKYGGRIKLVAKNTQLGMA